MTEYFEDLSEENLNLTYAKSIDNRAPAASPDSYEDITGKFPYDHYGTSYPPRVPRSGCGVRFELTHLQKVSVKLIGQYDVDLYISRRAITSLDNFIWLPCGVAESSLKTTTPGEEKKVFECKWPGSHWFAVLARNGHLTKTFPIEIHIDFSNAASDPADGN